MQVAKGESEHYSAVKDRPAHRRANAARVRVERGVTPAPLHPTPILGSGLKVSALRKHAAF